MPRDLPTRRVFLSRSHFVSFIPLVLLRVVSDPEVEEVETLYHAVFFSLGSTTLFMSHSFRRRVGHPARAVFGTPRCKSWNASFHQK